MILAHLETLRKIIRHFGPERQRLKAAEECAELTLAILHGNHNEMVEECADVLIMANQMRLILGPDLVDEWVKAKLERTQERMHG